MLLEGAIRATGLADGPDPGRAGQCSGGVGAGEGPYLETTQDGRLQTGRAEVEAGRMNDLVFSTAPSSERFAWCCSGFRGQRRAPRPRPASTIAGRLEVHLQRQGLRAEVLNLAGTSYTAAHVARVAREVMAAHPDAVVVYTGGNEHRAFTRRLYDQNQGWRGAVRIGQGLHLVRLLGRLASRIRGDGHAGPAPDAVHEVIAGQFALVADVMARLLADAGADGLPQWGPDGVPVRRDPGASAVVSAYRESLRAVVDAADNAESKPVVMLVKPPANRFTPPQLSLLTPGISEAREAEFHRLFDAGAQAQRAQDCRSALQSFEAALAIDTLHADTWHQHGKCLLEVGDPSGTARRNLDIALELDFASDRAGRALHSVVDELVTETAAHTVDLSADFGPRQDYGRRSFVDHVHLKQGGQDLVGQRLAERLRRRCGRGHDLGAGGWSLTLVLAVVGTIGLAGPGLWGGDTLPAGAFHPGHAFFAWHLGTVPAGGVLTQPPLGWPGSPSVQLIGGVPLSVAALLSGLGPLRAYGVALLVGPLLTAVAAWGWLGRWSRGTVGARSAATLSFVLSSFALAALGNGQLAKMLWVLPGTLWALDVFMDRADLRSGLYLLGSRCSACCRPRRWQSRFQWQQVYSWWRPTGWRGGVRHGCAVASASSSSGSVCSLACGFWGPLKTRGPDRR